MTADPVRWRSLYRIVPAKASFKFSSRRRNANRAAFPLDPSDNHSERVGPNGSDTFPSTAIDTKPVLARASAQISFCDGLAPPTKEILCSGMAISNWISARKSLVENAALISSGKPLAHCQEYASVRAEYPILQCFTGSASN